MYAQAPSDVDPAGEVEGKRGEGALRVVRGGAFDAGTAACLLVDLRVSGQAPNDGFVSP